MQTYAVYLKPRSSLITWPASDTLFGALCWAIHHLYGRERLRKFLEEFERKPKFVLSSSFPCLEGNGSRVHFFPKPLLPEPDSTEVDKLAQIRIKDDTGDPDLDRKRSIVLVSEKLKEIKKVTYISEDIFRQIVQGVLDTKGICSRLQEKGTIDQDIERLGNCLISYGEREKIDPDHELKDMLRETDVQKNQIDRVTGTTAEGLLFFKKETFFSIKSISLWLLILSDDLDFLEPLLRYLEDTGIGGEKTAGKGHFQIAINKKPYQLPQSDNPNAFITLSRYFPADAEKDNLKNDLAGWNILNLRPKRETMYGIGSPRILKDFLRLFSEGSVFPLVDQKDYYGRIISAGDMGSYVAYHNGLALSVFTRIGG